MNIARKILLIISSVLLFLIGTMILLFPQTFYALNGVTLGDQPGLLSEIRAPGGLLTGCAVVLILGVVRQNILRPALFLTALVYGTFGAARLFSIAVDGMPGSSLVAAAFVEIIIGTISALLIPGIESEHSAAETDAGERSIFAEEKLWN